jgi:hypothetical protein
MELFGVSPFFSRSEILSHEAVLSNFRRELKRRCEFNGFDNGRPGSHSTRQWLSSLLQLLFAINDTCHEGRL